MTDGSYACKGESSAASRSLQAGPPAGWLGVETGRGCPGVHLVAGSSQPLGQPLPPEEWINNKEKEFK